MPDHFVGTTPCDAEVRRFVGIAVGVPCDRITWRLALSGPPSTYTLTAAFGVQESSGPGLVNGGSVAHLHGAWSTLKGTNANASVVYRLSDASSGRSAAFARIGDNLLHLLNDDKRLAIGNASWSYTLSGTSALRRDVPSEPAVARKAAGVFEGRTPCQELARELGVSTRDDCVKLKWRLTLLEDPATGTPTTYKLEGTLYRDRPLIGTWSMAKDGHTNRIVYRLDLERSGTLSFVNADDNILFFLDSNGAYRVGNDAFSYTLNRSGGA